MNYVESKKKIETIRNEYECKGDVLFKTAIQMLMENGTMNFLNDSWYEKELRLINEYHDVAELHGKTLFVTREFNIAIIECAKELAQIEIYDLLMYIQREVWLGGGLVGEPDYQRALQIIRNCLWYTGEDCSESWVILDEFRKMELTDDEIEYFGWGYLMDAEEEEYDSE